MTVSVASVPPPPPPPQAARRDAPRTKARVFMQEETSNARAPGAARSSESARALQLRWTALVDRLAGEDGRLRLYGSRSPLEDSGLSGRTGPRRAWRRARPDRPSARAARAWSSRRAGRPGRA